MEPTTRILPRQGTNLLTGLLASGTLPVSRQANTSSTNSERTSATPNDSAAAIAADTVATVGNPKLLHTLDQAPTTPDGITLALSTNPPKYFSKDQASLCD